MTVKVESTTAQVQASGKSWHRIVEDLLRFIPGAGLLACPSLAATAVTNSQSFNQICCLHPDPLAEFVQENEVNNVSTIVHNYIFSNTFQHLEVEIEGQYPFLESIMHDFHLISSQLEDQIEQYSFQSSNSQLSTIVKITIRPREFSNDMLKDFEEASINERFERFKHLKPSAACPSPASCLFTLFKIIRQPLISDEQKEIMVNNPTLNIRINPVILESLFFNLDPERNCYVPPNVQDFADPSAVDIRKSMIRKLHEIALVGIKMKSQDNIHMAMENAVPRLKEAVSGYYYAETERYKHHFPLSLEQYGWYVALGAVETFGDDLILDRYQVQTINDSVNTPYYLESLRSIAQLRQSETLQMKVMELMSLGISSLSEVKDAYREFNLDIDSGEIDEALLLDVYKATVKERPNAKSSLRTALKVIGDHRRSNRLKQYLSIESMDLSDAYAYLQVTSSTDDDTIRVSYDFKVNEGEPGEETEEIAKAALFCIAKARLSPLLLNFYESQTLGTMPEINLNTAQDLIGITSGMDENSIITVYEIRLNDNPDSVLELRQALRTVGESLDSKLILKFLETGSKELQEVGTALIPVGLNNIGNTCYLNSLLQYYFTITPLRKAVLTFADSSDREDLGSVRNHPKKVGGRFIQEWEIKRSQEFVTYLSELFYELIHTNQTSVSPTRDLAYLALVPPTDEDYEIIDASAHNDSEKVTPLPSPDFGSTTGNQDEPILIDIDSENASLDLTANKENEKPKRDPSPEENDSRKRHASVTDVPEIDADVEMTTDQAPDVIEHNSSKEIRENVASGEVKRSSSSGATKYQRGEEMKRRQIDSALFGRQQDVTECIENVLFQIEAAFKPTGIEEDGEQKDIVKDLFYGKTKQVLESAHDGSSRREKTERFSSLLVDVAEGPRDIYDALDSYFGELILNLEDGSTRRSVTITELPPILQIQVQRVQFDKINFRPFKSLALLKFDEVIYMDRYIDTSDPEVIRKRRELAAWRLEMAELKVRLLKLNSTQSNGMTIRDSLNATREWFRTMIIKSSDYPDQQDLDDDENVDVEDYDEPKNIMDISLSESERLSKSSDRPKETKNVSQDVHQFTISDDTIKQLDIQIENLSEELFKITSRLSELDVLVKNQFADMKCLGYRIHSVFIHRGQATFGHYWIYINDMKAKQFRKYNDEYVTEIPDSMIYDESEENAATPYFLVFVREDLADDYVDALIRDPIVMQKDANSVIEPLL